MGGGKVLLVLLSCLAASSLDGFRRRDLTCPRFVMMMMRVGANQDWATLPYDSPHLLFRQVLQGLLIFLCDEGKNCSCSLSLFRHGDRPRRYVRTVYHIAACYGTGWRSMPNPPSYLPTHPFASSNMLQCALNQQPKPKP